MSPKSGDERAEGTGIRTFTTMGKTSGKETRGGGERGPRLRKAKEGEGGKHAGLKGPRVEGAGCLEAKNLGRKRVRREESEPAM